MDDTLICQLEIASSAAKTMISLLRTFEKVSPFVTLQFNAEHLLVSVINNSMTMFSVVRLDTSFFARYTCPREEMLGVKLETLVLCNSLRCEGIVNNTRISLKENSFELERQLDGCSRELIRLNYECVDFIQAVTPPMEEYSGNLLVALGSVWNRAFAPHMSTVDTQIQLHITPSVLNLLTTDKLCTQNSIPNPAFHTFSNNSKLGDYKLVAPLYELELISALASSLKALLQVRFGPGLPLIIEMVSVGGCLARFVLSVIDGELRDVNQRITNHRRKKRPPSHQQQTRPVEEFEAVEELEEMLITSDMTADL